MSDDREVVAKVRHGAATEGEALAQPSHAGRRQFLKHAAAATFGAAVAAPLVGAASAQAADSNYAYTDVTNVFSADQQINGHLGLNVVGYDPAVIKIAAPNMALLAYHQQDWQGQTHDLVNLYHKSSGDAIFVAHQGGAPPGYTGPVGADAAFNVLIPYYIDDSTTGRNGTIVNQNTGMRGLHVETQAVVANSTAIDVHHFSNDWAVHMYIQPPNQGQPVGSGGGVVSDDWSAASSIRVTKWTAPNPYTDAILNLATSVATPIDAIQLRDSSSLVRFRVRTDGSVYAGPFYTTVGAGSVAYRNILNAGDNFEAFQIQATGYMGWGAGGSASLDTNLYRGSANTLNSDGFFRIGRYLSAQNGNANRVLVGHNGTSETAGLAFGSALDTNLYRTAAAALKTDGALTVGGAFRHAGSTLGFYGATPVAKTSISGSKQGNQALASLMSALSGLGLVTDGTSG